MKIFDEKPWVKWVLFVSIVVVVFLVGLMTASIMERRTEALIAYAPVVPLMKNEPRNEIWGKNFPREHTSYMKTREMNFKSKHNGNKLIDMLEEDPMLVVLWAGYGFAKDYNQPRGHNYAIEDMRNTLRTGAPKDNKTGPMPNTCWTCKSPDVPRVMSDEGVAEFYKGKWSSRGHQVVNSIGCGDCHDQETMNLKITRPALIEAYKRMGKDINKATHQEKRSLVCAQCHVEYYFKGKGKYLTFPWDKGMNVEDMEKYYDEYNFKDWTHKISKAPMIKAQHPGYETYMHGIHAKRGVSCADCHMPYISEGGVKYTDHHVQSPLNAINRSCQVCHRQSEDELKRNVYSKQDKVFDLRMKAEKALVAAHVEAKKAWDLGAKQNEMNPILKLIRHAQWRWDYSVAAHGASFHASLEVTRILGTAIDKAGEARRLISKVLAKYGFTGEVKMPDLATKHLAQKYIGLNVAKMKSDKKVFLKTLVPEWDQKAKERHDKWDEEYKKMK